MVIDIEFHFTHVFISLTKEYSPMFNITKETFREKEDLKTDSIYTEFDLSEYFNDGSLLTTDVLTALILVDNHCGLFNDGTVYFKATANQCEEIRKLLMSNKDLLNGFLVKVIVNDNIITLKE